VCNVLFYVVLNLIWNLSYIFIEYNLSCKLNYYLNNDILRQYTIFEVNKLLWLKAITTVYYVPSLIDR